jgi:hypothetical protein
MAKPKTKQQQFEEASCAFLNSSEYLAAKSKDSDAAWQMYEEWKSSYKFSQASENFFRWLFSPPPWMTPKLSIIISISTGLALAIANINFILWLWSDIPRESSLLYFLFRNIPAFLITALAIYVAGYLASLVVINLFKYILAALVIASISIILIHFKTHDYRPITNQQPNNIPYK